MKRIPPIISEYYSITNEYRNTYGIKTILLMQVGSFYEVYAPPDKHDEEQIKACRDILGIRITKKGEDLMAGVPDHSYKRFEKKLIANGYTIVYMDQINKVSPIKREVTRIVSPGCNLDCDNDEDDAILLSVLLEPELDDFYIYISIYDANSGDIKIVSNPHLPGLSIEQIYENIYETIDTYRANEILFTIISDDKSKLDCKKLKDNLNKLVHNNVISKQEASKEILNQIYQKHILEKFFEKYNSIYENIFDILDLNGNIALPGDIGNMLLMLEFLKVHEPLLVKNLPIPKQVSYKNTSELITYNNAFHKLQVFSNEKDNLIHFINKTLTCSGKKKLLSLIRSPSCEINVLNERYDAIEFFMNNRNLLIDIKKHLHIRDLDRLYRRFAIGRIDAYGDIPNIHDINNRIITLLSIVITYSEKPHWIPNEEVFKSFEDYSSEIESIFCIEACKNGKGNVFNEGVSPELEKLYISYDECFKNLENIRSDLCSLSGETINLRNTEKDGYFFETTKKRATALKKGIESYIDAAAAPRLESWSSSNSFDPYLSKEAASNLKYSNNTSMVKITSDMTIKTTEEIVYLKHKIDTLTNKLVQEKVIAYYEKYYDTCFFQIIDSMAWMDVYYSYATIAIEWNYVRPKLVESENSFIKAKKLRHPMIEQLLANSKNQFVPNDIQLDSENNYLLYGVNSVGKSSLLKSVALSVIMSQSGMFVPAEEYVISPYEKLIVRIGNSDNLFEAHSSFVCEIREANNCVKHSDNKTLIIADEFCASTERDSAVQIVTTMLQWLDEKKASFIFATHLFELLDTVDSIESVKIAHLKIKEDGDGWIFDRKLTFGPPTQRNYGAIIARNIFSNPKFVKMLKRNEAKKTNRKKTKKSVYNSNLVVQECVVCKYSPENERSLPLDVHHINMQCSANSDGFIENFHKNNLHNLVVLCKSCHIKAHNGSLTINGWEQRDSGTILNYNCV